MSSTCDEETERNNRIEATNENQWQKVKNTKKRKITVKNSQSFNLNIYNRYSQLSDKKLEKIA